MRNQKEFTIDQVSWHTSIKDNPESPEKVKQRFRIITEFLQANRLTVCTLLPAGEEPKDDFAIRSTDLTAEGLEVMKKGYDKWLRRIVNKGKDLTDITILHKILDEIRGS